MARGVYIGHTAWPVIPLTRGVGVGVMVKCIAFSYGSYLLMLFQPSGEKQTGIHGHQTSITHETS